MRKMPKPKKPQAEYVFVNAYLVTRKAPMQAADARVQNHWAVLATLQTKNDGVHRRAQEYLLKEQYKSRERLGGEIYKKPFAAMVVVITEDEAAHDHWQGTEGEDAWEGSRSVPAPISSVPVAAHVKPVTKSKNEPVKGVRREKRRYRRKVPIPVAPITQRTPTVEELFALPGKLQASADVVGVSSRTQLVPYVRKKKAQ